MARIRKRQRDKKTRRQGAEPLPWWVGRLVIRAHPRYPWLKILPGFFRGSGVPFLINIAHLKDLRAGSRRHTVCIHLPTVSAPTRLRNRPLRKKGEYHHGLEFVSPLDSET